MPEISMKKHLWCHLEYEGYRISVHFSAWSGKEVVYIDDHPVSEKRNLLSFTGKHAIVLNKVPYTLELELINPFTYRVELRLKKGARTIIRKQHSSIGASKKSLIYASVFVSCFMIFGFAFGYIFSKLFVG